MSLCLNSRTGSLALIMFLNRLSKVVSLCLSLCIGPAVVGFIGLFSSNRGFFNEIVPSISKIVLPCRVTGI